MKVLCLIILLIFGWQNAVNAQPGYKAIGVRGSFDGIGFTAKYFLDRSFALEGQLNAGGIRAFNGQSLYTCALIEYHLQLPLPAFRIYFGGGLHAGIWTGRDQSSVRDEGILGLDGIGGVEYLLTRIPVSISGDLRPSINYIREVEFMAHNLIGGSIRYYFGSNKVRPFEYPWPVRRRFQ